MNCETDLNQCHWGVWQTTAPPLLGGCLLRQSAGGFTGLEAECHSKPSLGCETVTLPSWLYAFVTFGLPFQRGDQSSCHSHNDNNVPLAHKGGRKSPSVTVVVFGLWCGSWFHWDFFLKSPILTGSVCLSVWIKQLFVHQYLPSAPTGYLFMPLWPLEYIYIFLTAKRLTSKCCTLVLCLYLCVTNARGQALKLTHTFRTNVYWANHNSCCRLISTADRLTVLCHPVLDLEEGHSLGRLVGSRGWGVCWRSGGRKGVEWWTDCFGSHLKGSTFTLWLHC